MWEKIKSYFEGNVYWIWDIVMIAVAIDIGIRCSSPFVSIFFYIINCIINTILYFLFFFDIKDFMERNPQNISKKFKENFIKILPEYAMTLMLLYSIFVFILVK